MECKLRLQENTPSVVIGRSSTILECKLASLVISVILPAVEVAPYWNVNTMDLGKENEELKVEVAPYWNVNHKRKST